MMAPVKFGLVGYGFGGHYFHAPLINSAPVTYGEAAQGTVRLAAFARAVRDGAHVPVDPNDAVATARVLDAARTSATTGVAVEVKS
jgi:predicted dehydrogenase